MCASRTASALARQRLRFFGRSVADVSPLYSLLARHAADDDDIVALLSEAPDDDGQALLLLAAVHWLLRRSDSPLRRFYPSLGGTEAPCGRTWEEFRAFAIARRRDLRAVFLNRAVQTNEVQRSAVLYPAVAEAARRARGAIGLVEAGCSSGLLLGLDGYHYSYVMPDGSVAAAGNDSSAIRLRCRISDASVWPRPREFRVAARIGVDRNPLDCTSAEDLGWLEACVWADQPERIGQLRSAAAAQYDYQIKMIEGDAVADLAPAVAMIPEAVPVVLVTSWVLMYLSETRRAEFVREVCRLAERRPIWWVSNETFESCLSLIDRRYSDLAYTLTRRSVVALTGVYRGACETRVFGLADSHGYTMQML